MKIYSIRFSNSSPEKVTGDRVDYEDGIFKIHQGDQLVAIFPAMDVLIIKVVGQNGTTAPTA